ILRMRAQPERLGRSEVPPPTGFFPYKLDESSSTGSTLDARTESIECSPFLERGSHGTRGPNSGSGQPCVFRVVEVHPGFAVAAALRSVGGTIADVHLALSRHGAANPAPAVGHPRYPPVVGLLGCSTSSETTRACISASVCGPHGPLGGVDGPNGTPGPGAGA